MNILNRIKRIMAKVKGEFPLAMASILPSLELKILNSFDSSSILVQLKKIRDLNKTKKEKSESKNNGGDNEEAEEEEEDDFYDQKIELWNELISSGFDLNIFF